jgi:fatty-acyl-CoA synthase
MTAASPRDQGVGSWIERHARTRPDAVALIHGDDRRTYGDLAARVRRLARGLRALGAERGARVTWLGANHPAFLETFFATASIGAVLAPINHRMEPDAIREPLQRYEPAVGLIGPDAAGLPFDAALERRVIVDGASVEEIDYEQLLATSGDEPIDEENELDDLCLLPHTSGTSGRPKAVMLTHGNILWNVINMLSVADLRGDDVTVAVAPFFRTGGTGVNVLPVLFKGGAVVVPESSSPDEMFALFDRHHASIGFANPDMLEAWTRSPAWSTTELSSIRVLITGGAPVPEHLIRAYAERGTTFLQGYGLSEAAPLVLLLDPDHALDKIGSAGTPPLLVDVRIVGGDGAECAPEETGELWARGPNVMQG